MNKNMTLNWKNLTRTNLHLPSKVDANSTRFPEVESCRRIK